MESGNSFFSLIQLNRKVRVATAAELPFLIVNETRSLIEYRQSALYADESLLALSGIAQPDLNTPYVQWLIKLGIYLREKYIAETVVITSHDVPPELAEQWGEWIPAFLLWIPLTDNHAVVFVRDAMWDDESIALASEWAASWEHAWQAKQPKQTWSRTKARNTFTSIWRTRQDKSWWQQPRIWIIAVIIAVLLCPVRLSVLAPAELVAAHPEVIRAPLDGVIGQFHVQPNQTVVRGQLLFEFIDTTIKAQTQIAEQALATAEAEYRQNASLAVSENRSKAQLAALLGKIEEKRAEVDYLQQQLKRTKVIAPKAGIVVFDDPSEWIGTPVQTGERILRIADPRDIEIEAWLPLGDALIFPDNAKVQMYPSATPLHSLSGELRYVAFEAQVRPDGNFAYRMRASLDVNNEKNLNQKKSAQLGQKGTARIYATRVPLIYWVIRRPFAAIRQYLGV